ncbi:MAG TPA: hypothetical protein VNI61_05785 [Gemmatimonadales bacterium]|nr:hypothetical protein [Gemmatimonadales bacterium]
MRRLAPAVAVLTIQAATLAAQGRGLREVRPEGYGGLHVVVAQPLGEFRHTGDWSAGLTGFLLFGGAGLGLRLDGGYLQYDSDYRGYGVTTSSSVGSLGLGPQLTLGHGRLRAYGFATLGGSFFWTALTEDGYCGCYDGDTFFLNGRFTTTTQLGTGLLIVISRRRPVALDLGVRDVRHARVRYVPAGGITDHGDGSYSVERVETPVRMRVFQVGVSIGLR